MKMVQVDETFELAGQPWRAVHQDGTVIVFQHLLDRRVRKLPVAELLADPSGRRVTLGEIRRIVWRRRQKTTCWYRAR